MKLAEAGKQVLQNVLLRGSFLWRLPAGHDSALTFDDGPDPVHTPALLELLSRHGVLANFFLIGERAAAHPGLVRDIAAAGHGLGSHTQTHRELPTLDAAQLRWELLAGRDSIREAGGVDTRLMRPPRGRIDLKSLLGVNRCGFVMVHWSRTYSDYLQDGVDPLLARIRRRPLRNRDIALFHDTNAITVEALRRAIPEWLAAGRRFTVLK